jgi:hypothetical protein
MVSVIMVSVIMVSVILLNVIMLSVFGVMHVIVEAFHYGECHYYA